MINQLMKIHGGIEEVSARLSNISFNLYGLCPLEEKDTFPKNRIVSPKLQEVILKIEEMQKIAGEVQKLNLTNLALAITQDECE